MTKQIAINGFGRIGRTLLRSILKDSYARKTLLVGAINGGPNNPKHLAHLFAYDSVMGPYPGYVSYRDGTLFIDELRIPLLSISNPALCPWHELNIGWVIESSGQFTHRTSAATHCNAGAQKVLISAPGKEVDRTIIQGLTHERYNPKQDTIISLGSCTTNCFAPLIEVLDAFCGIEAGTMTTVHAYTGDQVLLDHDHTDLRRARAAALNIIPTKTGASQAIMELYPHLKGKLSARSLRVPTPNVSLVDFSFIMKKKRNSEEINEALTHASSHMLSSILAVTNKPLVSSDFLGNPASCIVDLQLTTTTASLATVFGWYDNEYGYCQRIKEFLLHNQQNLL